MEISPDISRALFQPLRGASGRGRRGRCDQAGGQAAVCAECQVTIPQEIVVSHFFGWTWRP